MILPSMAFGGTLFKNGPRVLELPQITYNISTKTRTDQMLGFE